MSNDTPMNQEDPMNDETTMPADGEGRSRFGRRGDAKPAKEPKPAKESRRGRGGKDAAAGTGNSGESRQPAAPSENRREIPVSCYDLLNGEFRVSARTRTGSVVVAFVVLFAVGYAGLVGVVEKAGTASENRKIAALQAERTELLSSFGQSTGLAGVTETALLDRDKTLSVGINAAVTQQPDIERLVNELKKISNPNITIRSIETGANVADPKATKEGKSEEPKAEEGAVTLVTQRVSISAESEDFDLLISWAEQLRSLTLLSDVVFSRKGKSVQIDAKFGPGVTPSAALELLQLFGSGSAISSSSGTTGTTSPTPNPSTSAGSQPSTTPSTPVEGQTQPASPVVNG